jgi:hypothetical protein
MSSDAEYVLSGLRREYESLSNDVFALRNDVYFLTEQLKKEILLNDKLVSIIRSNITEQTTIHLLEEILSEHKAKGNMS